MKIVKLAELLLREYALCDNCLGRQFAMLGHGLTNRKRGKALKLALVIEGSRLTNEECEKGEEILLSVANNGFSEIATETLKIFGLYADQRRVECSLCGGIFDSIEDLAENAAKELSKYEFSSFLVGIKADKEAESKEDDFRSKFGIKWGENIRNELSREIGKKIMDKTKKKVDMRRPDILVIINPFKGESFLEIHSLFISGKYRKLVRGIPQSRWICNECRGIGCEKCGGKGQLYPTSIEELMSNPLIEITNGSGIKFHASGREDIDVRTLGSGRPFIIEVKEPQLRNIDLEKLKKRINQGAKGKIEVNYLKFSSKEAVRKLKEEEKVVKIYRAIVEFEQKLNEEDLTKIRDLSNRIISQITPLRVAHRRAVKIRKRYLYELEIKRLEPNIVEMFIRCQGGLYIKELINGDEGRTEPSVTEIVGISVKDIELDVMKVETEAFD